MLSLVISSVFLPLILGQHEGYSKHKENRIFHQQHNDESPKPKHLQYSSIGSYSGSFEDSQPFPEDFSKNFIAPNGHSSKLPRLRTFEESNKSDKFQKPTDWEYVQQTNNPPAPNKMVERLKVNKFQEKNALDIRQHTNNHPVTRNLVDRQEINKLQQGNSLNIRQSINNYPKKLDQKYDKYQELNNVGVQRQINEFQGLRNFDSRLQYGKIQKQNDLENQRVNDVLATTNFEEKQKRGETYQTTKNLEEFPRKDRFHGTNDFEERPKNLRYQEDAAYQRGPGRHVSRPADPRHRGPRMSRNRDGKRSALPEVRRGQKVVKYIADKNGFAIREDLFKPLQDTIDRTQQESRRKVVMAVAGPQHGTRMAHVVTSAIRVTGQSGNSSGKFLPQIFDLKRSKHLNVDRLAHAIGAREVVI